MARTVAGLFPDRAVAEQVLAALEAASIERGRVREFSAQSEPHEAPPLKTFARTTAGAVIGSLILGSVGAVIGWLAALLWPTHTAILVTYAMVLIACVGGMMGWHLGGLGVRRIDTERKQYYRERVQRGRTIVAVDADARDAEVRHILARYGASNVPSITTQQAILPRFRSRRPMPESDTGPTPTATT